MRNGQRVLIVDDDGYNREALRDTLEDAGYVVEEAADGATALARLRSSPERLVALVDLLMSGVNGFQVAQAVAADAALAAQHAYIIISGASNADSPALHVLQADLHAPFLTKPFDIDHLLAMVEKAAERIA